MYMATVSEIINIKPESMTNYLDTLLKLYIE